MRRRLAAAAMAVVVVLVVVPSAARATQFQAYIGGDEAKGLPKQASPNAFYPRRLTIHPGDTVRWDWRGFHTVTFPVRGQGSPPLVLPDQKLPVDGVNDAAGNPFWFNGLPNLALNPVAIDKSTGSTYNGRSVIGTGVPQGRKPKPFALRFRRAGVFFYYCTVHPGMRGTVRVVSARRSVPSPAAQLSTAQRQLAVDVRGAQRLDKRKAPGGNIVSVGRTNRAAALYKMYPKTKTIQAGQTVSFTMAGQFHSEVHTVTFGPAKVRSGLERNFLGSIPGSSPPALGLNAQASYPSDRGPGLPPYDGSNHGDGFLNTGLIDNDALTPFPATARITFTKPGTYDYECVIHEHMDGRIVVR